MRCSRWFRLAPWRPGVPEPSHRAHQAHSGGSPTELLPTVDRVFAADSSPGIPNSFCPPEHRLASCLLWRWSRCAASGSTARGQSMTCCSDDSRIRVVRGIERHRPQLQPIGVCRKPRSVVGGGGTGEAAVRGIGRIAVRRRPLGRRRGDDAREFVRQRRDLKATPRVEQKQH